MVMCRPFILNSPTKTRIAKMQQFKMQFKLIEHANYCCYETIRKNCILGNYKFCKLYFIVLPNEEFQEKYEYLILYFIPHYDIKYLI